MLNIHFTCEGITDVSEFIKLYSNVFPRHWQGHFKGAKTGAFTIKRNADGRATVEHQPALKEAFDYQRAEQLLQEMKKLEQENVALKKELLKKGRKQDLSINKELILVIRAYRKSGLTFQQIADRLNEKNFRNSRGNKLNTMQVKRLFDKHQKETKVSLSKMAII
ncbi:MAG: hypothetical protein AB8G86_21635 [Saprospiraceae bacterium]